MKKLVVVSMVLFLCTSIYAQRNNNREYWNSWQYTAKEGMVDDFEKAAAKKTAQFNNTQETAIVTFRIVTGPDSGSYVRMESMKSPADYDRDRSAEGKYWNENVGPYIAKSDGQVRWRRLNNGSLNFDPGNTPPPKIVERTFYSVKADGVTDFRRFLERIAKVGEKRGWTAPRVLFKLVSGGNLNQFVLAVGFDTYERPESNVQNENSTREDYNEMFGWGTWEDDIQKFDESLEYWGEQRETMVLVPEMSTIISN